MFERDQPLGIPNNDEMWENINSSPTDGLIENNNVNLEKVCRDYLRNLCRRGKRCKFHHPVDKDTTILCSEYTFCHDYQNSSCNRTTCRFVHGTIEEETYYIKSGELPPNVLDHVIRNGIVPDVPAGLRVCKDYLKGECRRGGKCKFRHLNVRQYESEMFGIRNKTTDHEFESPETKRPRFTEPNSSTLTNIPQQQQPPPPLPPPTAASAAAAVAATPSNHHILIRGNKTLQAVHCYPALSASEARSIVLEEENSVLRKKVETLKKQVSDLTATNEFLLDQNAQLRMMGGKRTNVTSVTVPAVTITNTGGTGMQMQPLTQIQPATVTAGALRTVTASVATVPVPVSIAAVTMAPVQISPPVVTVAQQTLTVETAPGPPGDPGTPQGPPGTAPSIVSYPIMSQELRPVLQASLSH